MAVSERPTREWRRLSRHLGEPLGLGDGGERSAPALLTARRELSGRIGVSGAGSGRRERHLALLHEAGDG